MNTNEISESCPVLCMVNVIPNEHIEHLEQKHPIRQMMIYFIRVRKSIQEY